MIPCAGGIDTAGGKNDYFFHSIRIDFGLCVNLRINQNKNPHQ